MPHCNAVVILGKFITKHECYGKMQNLEYNTVIPRTFQHPTLEHLDFNTLLEESRNPIIMPLSCYTP